MLAKDEGPIDAPGVHVRSTLQLASGSAAPHEKFTGCSSDARGGHARGDARPAPGTKAAAEYSIVEALVLLSATATHAVCEGSAPGLDVFSNHTPEFTSVALDMQICTAVE